MPNSTRNDASEERSYLHGDAVALAEVAVWVKQRGDSLCMCAASKPSGPHASPMCARITARAQARRQRRRRRRGGETNSPSLQEEIRDRDPAGAIGAAEVETKHRQSCSKSCGDDVCMV
ncbi:hypothetical protein EYF80_061365 [Liparis tanakae]|uniref:Uncharacterized protein n=1 Tax=Liparis tanakae TaxID=230148 RepID=A0A4Z2EI22_9TELE|nr:hypothetical protein EYF80_061365 [Liparis tanakae]